MSLKSKLKRVGRIVAGAATLGLSEMHYASKKAKSEAGKINAANLAAQRTVNYRQAMLSFENMQQDAASLMSMAAGGGFGGSAIQHSMSSGMAQAYSSDKNQTEQEMYASIADNAAGRMQRAQRNYQTGAFVFNTGLQVLAKAAGSAG